MFTHRRLIALMAVVTLIAAVASGTVIWNTVQHLKNPDIDTIGAIADEATLQARKDGYNQFHFYTAGKGAHASTQFHAKLGDTTAAYFTEAVQYATKSARKLRVQSGMMWHGEVTGYVKNVEINAATESNVDAISALLAPIEDGQLVGLRSVTFEPYGVIIRGHECRADKVGKSGTWADGDCTVNTIESARTLVSALPDEFIRQSSVWIKFGPATNALFDGPRQWIAKADQDPQLPLNAFEMADKLARAAYEMAEERSVETTSAQPSSSAQRAES